jgi:hypothetical protein
MSDTNASHITESLDFVIDFWDVPIEGLARRKARSWHFRALFADERDEYSRIYEVTELSDSTLRIVADASIQWRKTRRHTRSSEMEKLMDALRKAVRRDRQVRPSEQVMLTFIRINQSSNFEEAFQVIWPPEGPSDCMGG